MAYATNFYTYLTEATGTKELLSTGDDWTQVTLRLESAGPVAIGENQELQPPASGRGRLLTQDVDLTFTVPPQTKIYVAATAVNRVGVIRQPFPWFAQIVALLGATAGSTASALTDAVGKIVNLGAFAFKGKMPTKK